MTQEMILLCNKVNAELQEDRFGYRMELISRCFEYDKKLFIDKQALKINPYYYNNYFNRLYDMNYHSLEEFEQKMFLIVKDYEESIAARIQIV